MILCADARALPLRDGCVQMVVTSPPYWNLRDYNTATWAGGDAGCDHRQQLGGEGPASARQNRSAGTQTIQFRDVCRTCGARRIDAQIGLEPTPAAYVAALVAVFREVWRVLRDDGTVWLNLGDSYAGSQQSGGIKGLNGLSNGPKHLETHYGGLLRKIPSGLKAKDLVGIPWRVAFALQADGWTLRSDIIWAKSNPMPESVSDRPTKSHEYVFLLSKRARYYYDADAIREPATSFGRQHTTGIQPPKVIALQQNGHAHNGVGGDLSINYERQIRNKRTVWTIPTQSFSGAHFATMPEALITPCVLAGCPPGGLVLDPFLGSATVGAVAERLGRRWVGCDLTYQALATARTVQRGLRFDALEQPTCLVEQESLV